MDTKRLTLDTTMTLIAAYLGLFVGLIDANAGITVGVAVLGSAWPASAAPVASESRR
jgi:hypothetical protein